MNEPNMSSSLDKIRIEQGNQQCREFFQQTYQESPAKALQLLQEEISFPCLFVLSPQLEASHLAPKLTPQQALALTIAKHISNSKPAKAHLLATKRTATHSALLWMVQSGAHELSLGNSYEKIMDIAISLLLNTYQEQSILPLAAELIFARAQVGHHVHDLVWAFFRSHHPETLKLVAEHIRAKDAQEVELACKLLHIQPPVSPSPAAKQAVYTAYLNWLAENDPYLFFSDESLQYANTPGICQVDLARKYLHKGTASYHYEPLSPANSQEAQLLQDFQALTQQEKAKLAGYSQVLQQNNPTTWENWLATPVKAQVADIKNRGRV